MERTGKVLAVAVTLGLGVAGMGIRTGAIEINGNNPGTDPQVTPINTPIGQLPLNIHHDKLHTSLNDVSSGVSDIKGVIVDKIHSLSANNQPTTTAPAQSNIITDPTLKTPRSQADLDSALRIIKSSINDPLCEPSPPPALVYGPNIELCIRPTTAVIVTDLLGQKAIEASLIIYSPAGGVEGDMLNTFASDTRECDAARVTIEVFGNDYIKHGGLSLDGNSGIDDVSFVARFDDQGLVRTPCDNPDFSPAPQKLNGAR